MNAATLALIVAAAFALLAVVALAWALMERRRAAAAEAKAWDLQAQFTTADACGKLTHLYPKIDA